MNSKVVYMSPYFSEVANFFKFTNLNGVSFEWLELQNSNRGCLDPNAIALRIPNKVRNMQWRVCKNAIHTKTNLVRRRVLLEGLCEL